MHMTLSSSVNAKLSHKHLQKVSEKFVWQYTNDRIFAYICIIWQTLVPLLCKHNNISQIWRKLVGSNTLLNLHFGDARFIFVSPDHFLGEQLQKPLSYLKWPLTPVDPSII